MDSRSADDRRANEILERTTVHKGGRYHVGMLWSEDDPELPNNYFSALAQFKSLERRLGKDPELSTSYAKTISDDLAKGYVVKIDNPQDPQQRSKTEWYLPHHPVLNPNKPGKVRRVLNERGSKVPWNVFEQFFVDRSGSIAEFDPCSPSLPSA